MGNCANIAVSDLNSLKPRWTNAVQFRDEFLRDRIAAFSAGFRPINNNTVELIGKAGNQSMQVEGARWSRGFTKGRHVIEFIYPVHLRAVGSRVGLGMKTTPLGGSSVEDLIGGPETFAIDLVSRKAFHNNCVIGTFPRKKVLPDWFFMYLDLDAGMVHFGSDTRYFGIAFKGIVVGDKPLYPIVTGTVKGAIVGIVYRGEGKEINGPLRKRRTLRDSSPPDTARSKRSRSPQKLSRSHSCVDNITCSFKSVLSRTFHCVAIVSGPNVWSFNPSPVSDWRPFQDNQLQFNLHVETVS